MTRNQFTFYRSFFTALGRIRKKSARADAYDAICRYALNGELPDTDKLDATSGAVMELILPVLKSGRKKAENRIKEKDVCFSQWEKQNGNKGEKEREVEKELEKELEKEIETESEKEGDGPAGEGGFERFWKIYPKKVGKQLARKEFRKVTVDLDTLLQGVRKQMDSAQWEKENGRFIPNPATWLSQKRWEDELPPARRVPMGANGLGKAELENIQRMLQES